MAPSLGKSSTVSTLAQVYNSLTHYPANWVEAGRDKGVDKGSVRISQALGMFAAFKALGSTTLQSECYARMFELVRPGEGHAPLMFPGEESTLGTWRVSRTQVHHAIVPASVVTQRERFV